VPRNDRAGASKRDGCSGRIRASCTAPGRAEEAGQDDADGLNWPGGAEGRAVEPSASSEACPVKNTARPGSRRRLARGGLGLDQPDREVGFGMAQRDHQPRVRAQVAHLDRTRLGEDQHRLAVPPEPRRDDGEAIGADRGQPHDGLRGQHRPYRSRVWTCEARYRPALDARGRCPVGRRGGQDAAEELHARRMRAARSRKTRRGSSHGMDIRRCLARTPEIGDGSHRGLTRSRVRSTHTA
jgi:hypothetical protein